MNRTAHLFMRRPTLEDVPPPTPPDGFRLRTYRPGDELPWLEIIRASYGGQWSDDAFERCIRSDDSFRQERLFFAEAVSKSEAHPVGTAAAFQKIFHGDRTGYVHMLAVLPEFQRRGIGAMLLRACLAYFRAQGWQDAVLDTETGRLPAIRLYLAHGFLPFPETPDEKATWQRILTQLGRTDLIYWPV